ncbi:peptidoglycan DD-metalloendopeptidase family protein [Vibrio sp. S17_S38]|uniref:murein hydrolase activator EnvC family protein n=1 Tax=Vibrio sp. S17_S38 TaxID=2720229 RepID=UPI001681673A|nr:peptidoglycan DD-metalloendopeptidase family protein [Vibrio sp. S17_S38]MBD1573255.1 peptidoglycan DD-metalloendopeptidase family protein [Vibrio sp. S17_S38]
MNSSPPTLQAKLVAIHASIYSIKHIFFRQSAKFGTFLSLVLSILLFPYSVQAASKDDLKGVSAQISRQTSSISSQQKQLNQLQNELKNHEIAISKLGQEIQHTQRELAKVHSNLEELQQQKQELEQTKAEQKNMLEQLIKAYYITSRNNDVSQLLQGGDPTEKDRISQYFQHLATARTKAIQALELTQSRLDEKEQQLSVEENKQATLLAEQKGKRDDLQKAQGQRKTTVAGIRTTIKSNQSSLAELRRNETRLKAEIAKAAKRNISPMDGLSRYKGRLPWPLTGSIAHSYGTSQSGQVTWKGIVINAKQGQAVKAVHSGKVVFAEWLRGYGLVILLDHGKGDMTLYGYNSTLLKKDGDVVTEGETIALAGNTGGQDRSALYFEVRRNSQAQNPKSWLK